MYKIKDGTNTFTAWLWEPAKYWRFGFIHEMIARDGRPYLERWILWFGKLGTLRLHRFWDGDTGDLHDHPFWFITIPLRSYEEVRWSNWKIGSKDLRRIEMVRDTEVRKVRAFLPHFRRATHAHRVLAPERPFFTLCITGPRSRKWGFQLQDGTWKSYSDYGVRYDKKERSI